MRTNLKKGFCLLVAVITSSFVFASEYKISTVIYNINGITRQYALETKVSVDRKKVFHSEEDLTKYLNDIQKQIENTRTFESVEYNYELSEPDENDLIAVNIFITTNDSLHFIGTPYAKYKSGDSISALIKIKDTNFLGSMETLTADLNFGVELDRDDKPEDFKFGFNIDFDTPFKMGALDAVWGNDLAFSYTIGDSSPEWNYTTGVKLTLPFDKFSFVWEFDQSFIRDFDYEGEWKGIDENKTYFEYNDDTYFKEHFKFSIPIVIQKVQNWGNIYYTPFYSIDYCWDFDGIDSKNKDLLGPEMSFGQTISTSRINWVENFRNGLSASITQTFSYNLNDYNFNPGISGELMLFKAFKRFAFSCDAYAYAYMNGNGSFGDRLRGIREDQYYDSEDPEIAIEKPCKSNAAFVFNFDLPIRICRIYWDTVPGIKKIKVARYFNMEVQLSPFVDVALFNNEATGSSFNIKDGFISGGLEGIVYPLKWKGIQIRGSLGVDLTRKMPKLKGKVNQEWRESCKSYELSIGIGLHY